MAFITYFVKPNQATEDTLWEALENLTENLAREEQTCYNKTRTITKPNTECVINNKATIPDIKTALTYHTFTIPKHSGGYRTITAPDAPLKQAQRDLLKILYNIHPAMHNAAFAFIPKRSCYDALKEHQENKSKWFLKLDLKEFFPSCTKSFVQKQIKKLFPFMLYTTAELKPIFELCFYKNALPQGAPTSPYLSNLAMIPLDYEINKKLYNHNRHHYVYTRYADDILISCREKFDKEEILALITEILKDTPLVINTNKTHFGAVAGRNWNLGLMLNKDNKITVGNKRKRYLKNSIHNLNTDLNEHKTWSLEDLYHLQGEIAYVKSIEPEYFREHITHKWPGNRIEADLITLIKLKLNPTQDVLSPLHNEDLYNL